VSSPPFNNSQTFWEKGSFWLEKRYMNIKMYVISGVKSHPCKIRTGMLAGSRWDTGEILADGIFISSGQIPARFSPGREIPSGQNLARIMS